MAESNSSLAALMKANPRLKAHAKTAKATTAQRDFTGPPGDYITKFRGTQLVTKDGNTIYIFRFSVDGSIEGQGDYNNASMDILHSLQDSERSTAEQNLERLFADIQRLGIDTANAELEQIDKELQALIGKHVTIRVVPNKVPGKRPYFNLAGVAKPATAKKQAASAAAEEYAPEPTAEPSGDSYHYTANENDAEEWNDELLADMEEQKTDDIKPSDWVGYEVEYKPAKAPKPLTFKVVEANDDDGTVILERDGKRVKAEFAKLIFPE